MTRLQNRSTYKSILGSALATTLIAGGIVATTANPAAAAGACDTTTPAMEQLVTCETAGTETVTVPQHAGTATIEVAGGGGGWAWTGSSMGGNGALVTGTLKVQGASSLSITVAGAVEATSATRGGPGGEWSGIQVDGSDAVIAGGGGGAGIGSNANGGHAGMNADGSGSPGTPDSKIFNGTRVHTGQGGFGMTGGAGGICTINDGANPCVPSEVPGGMDGLDGQPYAGNGGVPGGLRSTLAGNSSSGGGAGWGGGGGGAKDQAGGSSGGGSGGTLVASSHVENGVISSDGPEESEGGWVKITFHQGDIPPVPPVPPVVNKTCPLSVVKPRSARAKLPVGKWVTLVRRTGTAAKCKVAIKVNRKTLRGEVRAPFRLKKSANGKVRVRVNKRGVRIRMTAVANPRSEPYTKRSNTWKRSWRS